MRADSLKNRKRITLLPAWVNYVTIITYLLFKSKCIYITFRIVGSLFYGAILGNWTQGEWDSAEREESRPERQIIRHLQIIQAYVTIYSSKSGCQQSAVSTGCYATLSVVGFRFALPNLRISSELGSAGLKNDGSRPRGNFYSKVICNLNHNLKITLQ